MDLVALSIFLLAVVVCSVFVFIISVYGTKEVTFEENLKASHESSSKKGSKSSEAKKKNKKKAEISEPVSQVLILNWFWFWMPVMVFKIIIFRSRLKPRLRKNSERRLKRSKQLLGWQFHRFSIPRSLRRSLQSSKTKWWRLENCLRNGSGFGSCSVDLLIFP